MYNHDYQVTHDLDCFFILNGNRTHIASNGGIVHPKIGTVEEIRAMQSQVAKMEGARRFVLNTEYLSSLSEEDFPRQEEIDELMNGNESPAYDYNIFEESGYGNIPYHWKLYSYDFAEMAGKGFWSFDRVGIFPNGLDAYMLVARPSETQTENRVEIGHQFKVDDFENYRCYCGYSCCWPLMEMIRNAQKV